MYGLAAPASGSRYAVDSQFTRAVRGLAERFEHRLFLSATPHNGHSNSFSTLLELLDPYRFTRGVKVRGKKALEDVMVRRLKEDIRQVQGKERLAELARMLAGDDTAVAREHAAELLEAARADRAARVVAEKPSRRRR